MTANRVPWFLPSVSGFRFSNAFPRVPLRWIGVPGVLRVPIGDASNGLCGGMVFAARDYFEAGLPLLTTRHLPATVRCSTTSCTDCSTASTCRGDRPATSELMNPLLEDGETVWSRLGWAPHGRIWRMARAEWPAIRAEIDSGHPCPLGLVRVISTDPLDLKENHQVLAYGYELDADRITLLLYDPNRPGRDDVTISLDRRRTPDPVPVTTRPSGTRVYSFFRVAYRSATPP